MSKTLQEWILELPGVTQAPHRFGGTEFQVQGLEFMHSHGSSYYYYDALHGLRVLTKLGYGDEERVRGAVHLVLSKRTPEGKWLLEGDWLRERKGENAVKRRKTIVNLETLMKPSKWVTLNCYRALSATKDLEISKNYLT